MKKVSDEPKITSYQKAIYGNGYSNSRQNSKRTFETEAVFQKTINRELDTTSLFNILYGDVYYGKMDNSNNIIVPNDNFISSINYFNGNKSALCFVVDAYKELTDEWNSLVESGNIQEIHNINLDPKVCYENFEIHYRNSIIDCFTEFVDYINVKKHSEKIINFKSFIKVFLEYIPLYTAHSNFFITDFIQSNRSPYSSTGLVVNLQENVSGYRDKEEFIASKKFEVLSELCYLHGFIIEKSDPSKIFFNIHSPKAREYINNYLEENESVERDFYKKFFVKTREYDFLFFKRYLLLFYKMYVNYEPNTAIRYKTFCRNVLTIKTKMVDKERIDFLKSQDIENNSSDLYLWRAYLFTRFCQEKVYITQHHFESLVSETHRLQKRLDADEVSSYLEKKLKSLPRSAGKERNFSY